jgi:hypothetical protein
MCRPYYFEKPSRVLGSLLVTTFLGCGPEADLPPDGTAGSVGAASAGAGAMMSSDGTSPAGHPSGLGGGGGAENGTSSSGGASVVTEHGEGGAGGAMDGDPPDVQPRIFDAGSDPGRNRPAAGAVCDRFATIQCAGERYCCDSPGRTFDQCYAAQLAACRDEAFLDIITLNVVTGYSLDMAELAFGEFERLASQCDPDVAEWASSTDGLRSITQGTVAPGGSCVPPALADVPTSAAFAVSCTQIETNACLPTLLNWTCRARGSAGDDCFTDLNCIDGLFCDNPSLSLSGSQCQLRKANGQSCSEQNECASLTCRGGTCVAATTQTAYCLVQ